MREAVLIALMTACSYGPPRLDPDAPADAAGDPDSAVATDTGVDGFVGPPPTACVAKWLAGTQTFGTPAFVQGSGIVTIADERDPFVSADGRVLYFVARSSGTDEILFATRASDSGPFGNLLIKAISTPDDDDSKITLTGDDLTAVFSTRRAGGEGGFDFWQATRATGFDAVFDAPIQTHLGTLNDATDQLDPHISPDGLRLYFAAGTPPMQSIVVSERASLTADFPAPTPLANLGDGFSNADPTLTGDERVIIFTSSRVQANLSDLFYATRAERDQPFSAPQPLSINTTFLDGDPHISPDGCTLYFASTRQGSGDYDLFVATVQ